MKSNIRLKVEWVSGTSRNCYHVTNTRVTSMWKLTDEQAIAAVCMAGLGGGQVVRVAGRGNVTVPDDNTPNYSHQYHTVDVVTECDSGD